jgi:hypothetical protein
LADTLSSDVVVFYFIGKKAPSQAWKEKEKVDRPEKTPFFSFFLFLLLSYSLHTK